MLSPADGFIDLNLIRIPPFAFAQLTYRSNSSFVGSNSISESSPSTARLKRRRWNTIVTKSQIGPAWWGVQFSGGIRCSLGHEIKRSLSPDAHECLDMGDWTSWIASGNQRAYFRKAWNAPRRLESFTHRFSTGRSAGLSLETLASNSTGGT